MQNMGISDTAREILKKYYGHDSFRGGQEEIISHLVAGEDVLAIMPTGAGKSICYQIPALMADGITLVVSPLISLMNDQVSALVQAGIRGAYYNSSLNEAQSRKMLSNMVRGVYKIIYVAPERLESEFFLDVCSQLDISYIAIDESHCVSQWGQDFRPSYLKIMDFVDKLPRRPVIGAFTATATGEVRNDIIKILKLKDPFVLTTGFDRPNLYFDARTVHTKRDKVEELIAIMSEKKDQSGIIYCSTRKAVEEVYTNLDALGYPVTKYHAGLSQEERIKNQEDFIYDRKPIVVATNAFGMGIDKSNVSFVIHYNMPKNIENYYQEAGRAGRDGSPASCYMLYSPTDVFTIKYFIENQEEIEGISPKMREEIKRKDLMRMNMMIGYCNSSLCLRNYILRYFGEYRNEKCGNCSSCTDAKRASELRSRLPLKKNAGAKNTGAKNSVYIDNAKRKPPTSSELLYDELRAMRVKLAKEQNVPPYIIFSDKVLRALCDEKPLSIDALMKISGIGSYKAEKYGKAIINTIKAASHKKAERAEETEDIDKCIVADYKAGIRGAVLAKKYNMSVGELQYKLKRLL